MASEQEGCCSPYTEDACLKADRWDAAQDGPLSEKSLRAKLERLGYEVSLYTYPPGTVFTNHSHSSDKIDAVLKGRFKMSVGSQSVILEAGDSFSVPKGTVHSAEVVGSEPVVSLDAVKRG